MGTPDAVRLVDHYLQLCEDRRLDEAGRFLAPQARLVFPAGREYSSLAQMAAGSAGTYRWVRKHRDRYLVGDAEGRVSVTSLGRLYGEWLDGTSFDGIRYADVFVLDDGLIAEQHVYNDLALVASLRNA
ncbi:nuclear transport factor 2 family protein [Micromonospora echinofusca]|uniref:SnoaL-like domain-containing protein n=1 Tax=Micromonospora echinofusca TaxID=47858 RepID=A0ABS3VMI5_MICEH|nr:hypothetical protein [Micromonospora echinofusca]MBO4205678.1 hypothetical protein [Micromonospora echinofusca]